MGSDNENSREQPPQDDSQNDAEINNEISGGRFEGPVGQFGSVYGDVNLNPPKSPEEAAFRARYMAKMQEAWDAEEKKKADEEKYAPIHAGCVAIIVLIFVAFVIFWIVSFYQTATDPRFPPFP